MDYLFIGILVVVRISNGGEMGSDGYAGFKVSGK